MCEQNVIISKVEELREWQTILNEATEIVESIKDFIKSEMNEHGVEEMEAGAYICRFTTVLSNRFDTTAFKKQYGDLYKAFTRQSISKRFSVN